MLYVGITNDLPRRVHEHKTKVASSFTSRYNVNELVYFEQFSDVNAAIAREKQIKAGSQAKKITLINGTNQNWLDLSDALN